MELPVNLREMAFAELGETTEKRIESLKALREKLKEFDKNMDSHRIYKLDDQSLLRFLRVSKFDVKKAFDRMSLYFEGRKKYEKDYERMGPEVAVPLIKRKIINILPEKTEEGRIIIYVDFENYDPKLFTSEDVYLSCVCCLEILIRDVEYQVAGAEIIHNCRGFTFRHLLQWTPSVTAKFVTAILKMLPLRVKALHFLNESFLFKTLFNVAYPFLPNKLKKRFHFHGSDIEKFHSFVSPKSLPEHCGGTGAEMDVEKMIQFLFPNYVET